MISFLIIRETKSESGTIMTQDTTAVGTVKITRATGMFLARI